MRSPFDGIGKPEPLRQGLSGYWSRRITDEHRMVYRQVEANLLLIQLRYHLQKIIRTGQGRLIVGARPSFMRNSSTL
jgi:hypothetical protein